MFISMTMLLIVLGIGIQIIIGVACQKMVAETKNMKDTRNPELLKCKKTYEDNMRWNEKIVNVPLLVEESMENLSIKGFSIRLLHHLSGQSILLAIFFGGIQICREIIKGEPLDKLGPYYFICFIGLYAYFSAVSLVDISENKRKMKINMEDYFKNSKRVDTEKENMERLLQKKLEMEFQQEYKKKKRKEKNSMRNMEEKLERKEGKEESFA